MKRVAKAVVPAPVWNALRRWRHAEKLYWTWAGARHAAGRYDNEMLTRFRIARDQAPVEPIAADHPLSVAISRLSGVVRITDLGGDTGRLAREVRLRFPNAQITVVEHPGMVAACRPEEGVRWATAIPPSCDVFFTSGTLQYLDAPYGALKQGCRSAAHGVVLMRNSFANRTLVRVQRCRLFDNGSGPIPAGFDDISMSYPHRTIKERRVLSIAAVDGFRLQQTAAGGSGVLPYGREVYGKDLFFWRHAE